MNGETYLGLSLLSPLCCMLQHVKGQLTFTECEQNYEQNKRRCYGNTQEVSGRIRMEGYTDIRYGYRYSEQIQCVECRNACAYINSGSPQRLYPPVFCKYTTSIRHDNSNREVYNSPEKQHQKASSPARTLRNPTQYKKTLQLLQTLRAVLIYTYTRVIQTANLYERDESF